MVFRQLFSGLCLGLLVSTAATAQQQVPPPASAFFDWPDIEGAQLSPSGRYVALTTAKLTGRQVLYVFDLHPGGKPTQAVAYRDMDVDSFSWVSDQRLVFELEDRSLPGHSAGQRGSGLMAVDRDGGNLRDLPAGFMYGVPQDESNEVLVGEYRGGAGRRPQRMNVNSGVRRLIEGLRLPSTDAGGWQFDSQGEARIASAFDADRYEVRYWVRPRGEQDWRLVVEGPLATLPFTPIGVDDLGNFYVTERSGAGGTAVIKRLDLKTGQPEREPLVSAPGFDLDPTLIKRKGGGLLGLRIETDAEQTLWLAPDMRKFQAEVDAKLPGRINRISCRRCGEPEMVALVLSYSDREPGQYFVVRGEQWQSIGRSRPAIDETQMGRRELQRIPARDGRDLPVWLTVPKGVKAGQPAPTVVLVHGGPWVRGGFWRWGGYAQFLASRGYLVIEPDFRGSEGYGRAHLEAGFKQFGQTMQDDVADALLWAQKQGLASDKACIAGGSYGGYATFAGLMRHPELFRCGLAWVAVTDLMLMTKGSPFISTDVSRAGRRYSYEVMVGDPDKDAEMLRANSPVENATKIKAPVMLVMGESDLRVPIAHGKRMRDAMKAAGNPVEWHSYQDEGHGWYLQANRIDFANRMERFFAKHLR